MLMCNSALYFHSASEWKYMLILKERENDLVFDAFDGQ